MVTNSGSLGEIFKDYAGDIYTIEDQGYASRYWFNNLEAAKEWLKKFVDSYHYNGRELFRKRNR